MDRFQYESLIADATARDEAARQINGIARTFARKIAPLYRALGIRWSDYFPRHEQIVEAIRDLSLEFNKTPGLTSISRRGIEISLDSGCWRLRFVYGMMGVIGEKEKK